MPFAPYGGSGMILQATTGIAGFPLVNGTPTILTWTPPNDGNMHYALLMATLIVTVAQTGGIVTLGYNDPSGVARGRTVYAGGLGVSYNLSGYQITPVQGGVPVLVTQSAQTAGTSTLWAAIFGV
jgi:hypothetical protein